MTPDTQHPAPFVTSLRCLRCGAEYQPAAIEYVCGCRPNAGSDLGTLDVQYDYAAIAAATSPEQITADPDHSIGRWWALLPVRRESLPPLPVGNTPLLHAKRLGESVDLPNLYIKDDGRNPSASFKDRASAIAVARAQEKGAAIVATASTGNAAAALAGQAAAAGQPSVIFVPKTAPAAKIAQLLVYGSRVLAVDGSYDDAFDLCIAACQEFGWYNRNTGYNPYMTEGKKTVAYEIAEQLQVAGGKLQVAGGKWQVASRRLQVAGGGIDTSTCHFPLATLSSSLSATAASSAGCIRASKICWLWAGSSGCPVSMACSPQAAQPCTMRGGTVGRFPCLCRPPPGPTASASTPRATR